MSTINGYGDDCRLCGKVSNFNETFNIFEKTEDGVQLVQMIKDLLPILVYRTDPLSKRICDVCCTNVKGFYKFKRCCLELFNKQKEKLESKHEINENEKLFLNTINNSFCSLQKNGFTDSVHSDEADSQKSEAELCAELQNAIKESLTQTQLQEKSQDFFDHKENSVKVPEHVINGIANDQNSKDGFENKNEESLSDMELCESPPPMLEIKKRSLEDENVTQENQMKRRKLVGPKSCIDRLRKKYGYSPVREIKKMEDPYVYNPLTLLKCVLNYLNKQNVPDFESHHYTKCTLSSLKDWELFEDFKKESVCKHCGIQFENLKILAEHETEHMQILLKDKVDSPSFNVNSNLQMKVQNWWSKDQNDVSENDSNDVELVNLEKENTSNVNNEEVVIEDTKAEENVVEEQNLLIPVEAKTSDGTSRGEVVLIDMIAMVNGTPLAEMPKDFRRTLFKSVTVNGVKRKFCPLCRYTFKDNWAIESHYFSTGCHFTCRFCGLRFNKQKAEFDEHVKNHILNGDKQTDKIFASRKSHLPPKVIDRTRMKAKLSYIPVKKMPKIKAHKMRSVYKKHEQLKREIKKNIKKDVIMSLPEKSNADSQKPQNQAYFCRKCYQVFFKLDEFNVHVGNCTGTGSITDTHSPRPYNRNSNSTTSARKRKTSEGENKSDNELYSPSGRPIRHCVKEAGPYVDGSEVDEMIRSKPTIVNSSEPTERGYECSLCSSCFPTKYSRNSHMRIHKNDYGFKKLNDQSIVISRNRQENVAKKVANVMEHRNIPTFARYVNEVRIKQELTEPIVEIHEGEAGNISIPSSIGSVSITPIPNTMNQKSNVDPSIMRLVQGNPNITIKTMNNKGRNSDQYYTQNNRFNSRSDSPELDTSQDNSSDNDGRCYRCSSCSKPFANKSNLYFHKKHQCTGSKYPCPFCRKRFGTESAYSSHIFYNHPE